MTFGYKGEIPLKYLFFDIECANCQGSQGKIFSFGYLVTDRDFNFLVPPTDILMNPDSHFEPYVLNKILSYPMEQIKSSPEFPEHYERLKALLEDPDTMVVGFAVAFCWMNATDTVWSRFPSVSMMFNRFWKDRISTRKSAVWKRRTRRGVEKCPRLCTEAMRMPS